MYIVAYLTLSASPPRLRSKNKSDRYIILLWPLYFILHSIAAYMALYQILTAPFYWNKTSHGLLEELYDSDHEKDLSL
jgi:hypothetical protein